jgi:ribonuclease G
MIKNHESVAIEIERALLRLLYQERYQQLKLVCHPHLDNYLDQQDKDFLQQLSEKHQANLTFEVKDTLHLNAYEFFDETGSMITI